ncbi:MAG: ArsR/SmtB family transcription factor [Candidatus Norongarragalinales archaeon]
MKNIEKFRAKVFNALADPVRLKILECLRDGEKCVCEIIPYVGIAQPLVSRHLAILKSCGIVKCRKHKNRRLYSVSDPELFRVIDVVDASLLNALSRRIIEEIA